MTHYRILRNQTTGDILLRRAKWCVSAWCHFKGLQFVRHLPADEGLIFVRHSESISATAIHMFFMFFDIAVIWADKNGVVVDKKYAKVWRPAYAPRTKAQYYIEANPSLLDKVNIGDQLSFDEASS
jgi:uncharacterized membrane protein (UPF0127 family)